MSTKLFHYTNVAGLIGIIKDECIWLTDHHFLNDREERTFSARLVRNALASIDTERLRNSLSEDNQTRFDRILSGLQSGYLAGLCNANLIPCM